MNISRSSPHYRWGEFFNAWSLFRSKDNPSTICSYFWGWIVWPPIGMALSGLLIPAAVIAVVAMALLVFLGPLTLGVWFFVDPYFYCWDERSGEMVATCFVYVGPFVSIPAFLLQAVIWLVVWRAIVKETGRGELPTPVREPLASGADAFLEWLLSIKRKVCPVVEYRE